MATQFPLQASNGQQIISIPGGAVGFHTANLAFTQAPSAGSVTIEARTIGSASWVPVLKATNLSITSGEAAVQIDGILAAIRVTFSSLVGGASPVLWLSTGLSPQGLFEGLRAITTQSYTEANVKNGVQFSLATFVPAFPQAPGFTDYVVEVGAKPIAIKGRTFQFDGAGIQLDVYRSPTYTGGTPFPYFNQNDINPVAGLAVVKTGVTVTATGTKVAPTRTMLGSTGQGNSVITSSVSEAEGLESILRANTAYLFRTTSLHTSAQRVASSNTWYEGGLDLPLR